MNSDLEEQLERIRRRLKSVWVDEDGEETPFLQDLTVEGLAVEDVAAGRRVVLRFRHRLRPRVLFVHVFRSPEVFLDDPQVDEGLDFNLALNAGLLHLWELDVDQAAEVETTFSHQV